MRRKWYYKNMRVDFQTTVQNCGECAKHRGTTQDHHKIMKLLPESGSFDFIGTDSLGLLPVTNNVNRFSLGMTDQFSKLTRSIQMRTTTALTVGEQFIEHYNIPYGPRNTYCTIMSRSSWLKYSKQSAHASN